MATPSGTHSCSRPHLPSCSARSLALLGPLHDFPPRSLPPCPLQQYKHRYSQSGYKGNYSNPLGDSQERWGPKQGMPGGKGAWQLPGPRLGSLACPCFDLSIYSTSITQHPLKPGSGQFRHSSDASGEAETLLSSWVSSSSPPGQSPPPRGSPTSSFCNKITQASSHLASFCACFFCEHV